MYTCTLKPVTVIFECLFPFVFLSLLYDLVSIRSNWIYWFVVNCIFPLYDDLCYSVAGANASAICFV